MNEVLLKKILKDQAALIVVILMIVVPCWVEFNRVQNNYTSHLERILEARSIRPGAADTISVQDYSSLYSAITAVVSNYIAGVVGFLTFLLILIQLHEIRNSNIRHEQLYQRDKIDREKQEYLRLSELIESRTDKLGYLRSNGIRAVVDAAEMAPAVIGEWDRCKKEGEESWAGVELLLLIENCLPILGLMRLQLHQALFYEKESFDFVVGLRNNVPNLVARNLIAIKELFDNCDIDSIPNPAFPKNLRHFLEVINLYQASNADLIKKKIGQ